MIVLLYRILNVIVTLSHYVGDKAKDKMFKRLLLELVVYPLVLILLTCWIIYLIVSASTTGWSLEIVVSIVGAQEVVVDSIVILLTKKIDAATGIKKEDC